MTSRFITIAFLYAFVYFDNLLKHFSINGSSLLSQTLPRKSAICSSVLPSQVFSTSLSSVTYILSVSDATI